MLVLITSKTSLKGPDPEAIDIKLLASMEESGDVFHRA